MFKHIKNVVANPMSSGNFKECFDKPRNFLDLVARFSSTDTNFGGKARSFETVGFLMFNTKNEVYRDTWRTFNNVYKIETRKEYYESL